MQNNGRAQVVYCSRQLCGSEDRGSAYRETKSKKVVKPWFTTDFRELSFGKARMSSPCEHMKKEFCAPLSTQHMLEINDGATDS